MRDLTVSRFCLAILLLAASGCSGDPGEVPVVTQSNAGDSVSEAGRAGDSDTLARTHEMTVDVDAGTLEESYRAVQGR
ncbi:MAG: hypothetical protein OXT64_02955 [Gammaproteobacteria bacterium]|nr:hypothetical protein [Gammaproteobacteria bacterium]